MNEYRNLGPAGLERWIRIHGTAASPMLDQICAQRDAHTSLLYWFTDLDVALDEARRTHRPILSLQLLGRLDEELSCANSRFFRKLLYRDPQISRVMRERFVLHWRSVCSVPRVIIDFGDGRRVERTLTGNSVHVVLDIHGRPVDAIPGLLSPEVFLSQLAQARSFGLARRDQLARIHRLARISIPYVDTPSPAPAMKASLLAASKHRVEGPLLRAALPPTTSTDVIRDTAQNLRLHRRIHDRFANGTDCSDLVGFVQWIYAELFEMPLNDAALGLDVPDPFPILVPMEVAGESLEQQPVHYSS